MYIVFSFIGVDFFWISLARFFEGGELLFGPTFSISSFLLVLNLFVPPQEASGSDVESAPLFREANDEPHGEASGALRTTCGFLVAAGGRILGGHPDEEFFMVGGNVSLAFGLAAPILPRNTPLSFADSKCFWGDFLSMGDLANSCFVRVESFSALFYRLLQCPLLPNARHGNDASIQSWSYHDP
jgi:hypothetical protein